MQGRSLYRQAVDFLRGKQVRDADFSARYLLAFVLGCETKELPLRWEAEVSRLRGMRFLSLVKRRAQGKPLAYLVGYADFYGERFCVPSGVLIPRPDSEHILYAVQEIRRPFSSILDVGTGCGVLALSLAPFFPCARIEAIDISRRAVRVARKNKKRLHCENVRVFRCDFLRHPPFQTYDLIVSNPPYIAWQDREMIDVSVRQYEPKTALFGGDDGLVFYRALAMYAQSHLRRDGYVVMETDHKWEAAGGFFGAVGMRWHVKRDYQDMPRVLVVHW